MATNPGMGRVDDDEQDVQQQQQLLLRPDDDEDCDQHGVVATTEAVTNKPRVSRLAVEGGGGSAATCRSPAKLENDGGRGAEAVHGRLRSAVGERALLPPPHAWLAVEDTKKQTKHRDKYTSGPDDEEQWTRLLHGGGGGGTSSRLHQPPRRNSFSVVRRERAAREAWLDRAWEMKRSWHERNGGAPDADTPVVVVVGGTASDVDSHDHHHHHHHVHGVAMDVDEVRACRDLGLELPSDCTVEVQCYGLSGGGSSPTHHTCSGGAAGDVHSPRGVISSHGGASAGDPTDVKARLKVWAHAVALASTTQLGS